ncbi:MAG: hypothetical protein ACLUNZ_09290 [Evtepia sp.]
MGKFILKRLGQMVLVLLAVSVIIFALVHHAPDPMATQGRASVKRRNRSREHGHLDKSAREQYMAWATGIFKGDLGEESTSINSSVGFP